MLFSSVTFLYYFLPAVLLLYFIVPNKLKNTVLLLASLVFYAWGEPVYVFLMIGSSLAGWILGLVIDKFRGKLMSKIALIASLVIGIGTLAFFKYSNFFIENVNRLLSSPIALINLVLPIGISFYTFQILSYTIDLYRGNASVQKNYFTFATYVMLFPQLIAGPIVRYTTVADELKNRKHSWESFGEGASRFVVGLGKKVLIANILGELCELFKNSSENSVLYAWMYIIAFCLQIYFDFSGYSDMAIGLGRIFGFHFLENFNYPYISKSITEFWRRWHISLGTWFRDYVYIPLGGNRVSPMRHLLNIFVVWFLTGFWHGAGWNFIVWGLYFGVMLVLEKYFLLKLLDKAPSILRHIYVLLIVAISFVFFDASAIGTAFERIKMMIGIGTNSFAGEESLYYLRSYLVPLVIGIIGATPIPKLIFNKVNQTDAGCKITTVLQPVCIAALIVVITAYLIDGSFNPFIYFRF